MNREEALRTLRERFPEMDKFLTAPPWWPGDLDTAEKLLRNLPGVKVKEIGRSAGGRAILAAEWGVKEPLETTSDSLHSSLAADGNQVDPTKIFPESFYGRNKRTRQVLVIQGAIHGMEIEGTVAALNLLHVLQDGTDLRGRRWDALRQEASGLRIIVIPFANPDGRARSPVQHFVGASEKMSQTVLMGLWKDGAALVYPAHKNTWPLPLDKVLYLGAYFNDNGVNLQYDGFAPKRQPETEALTAYYLQERPDAVLVSHSNAGSLIDAPDPYLPPPHQHQLSRLGAAVRQHVLRAGLPAGRLSRVQLPGLGAAVFTQSTHVYHACGALPILCEFPSGHPQQPYTMDQVLDVGLLALEAVCFYANRDGIRPLRVWDKKKV